MATQQKAPDPKIGGQDWCARQDLNLHALRHYHLKVARLPIPPRARFFPRYRYPEVTTPSDCRRDGRGGEIRTHDLLYPKQARYQATLRPVPNAARKLRNGRPRCNGFLSENHLTDGFGPISGHFEDLQNGNQEPRSEPLPVFGLQLEDPSKGFQWAVLTHGSRFRMETSVPKPSGG